MTTIKNAKKDVLAELISKRSENISLASKWKTWELEDQIKRAEAAKQSFLSKDPLHDTRIISEQLYQLTEALKINMDAGSDVIA